MWKLVLIAIVCGAMVVSGDDPYKFFTWNVTYGDIYPLGFRQQGILINGQFPGPEISADTNDNLIINVFNNLDEPFLLSWNGIQNRKNSFEDGVNGTTCPIPPAGNFTYRLQIKDQIGSFFYFPSTAFHKSAGGYGPIRIFSRPRIPVPFAPPPPDKDFTILIGEAYKSNHKRLKSILDNGKKLPLPDGALINGRSNGSNITVESGETYRLRISNVGLQNTYNFRIEGHTMKLVEVEGTHVMQMEITSLDVHVGQSYSVLVTANQSAHRDYYMVASSRFTPQPQLVSTALLHYSGSTINASGPLPPGPTGQTQWSLEQARSTRTNLTASGPRPNPQGSYKYGLINVTRRIRLRSSAAIVNKAQRYGLNGVSFVPAETPLKLADYFNIPGVFTVGSIPDNPPKGNSNLRLDTSVMGADYKAFIEIVFENYSNITCTYHLDGYAFFVVGMDVGKWKPKSVEQYNLHDAVSRSTVQVYSNSWTAIRLALDNVGMWNLRSQLWGRQYLGEQFYLRVNASVKSPRDEYDIPSNALLCGRALNR